MGGFNNVFNNRYLLMKKIILIVVIIVFALSATLLVFGISNKMQKQVQITGKIQKLPSFSFMTLTDGSFNSSDIRKGPVLVVRFHPECEHCRYEITEILNSNIPVSGTLVLMVSSADTDSIRKLLSQFDLSDYPAIIPLVDTSYIFGDIFGSDVVPSNYIYDKQLDLVKVLQGEVKTETILKYLQVSEQD
jgi:thiol-disulfide isomerase/thioredoxin